MDTFRHVLTLAEQGLLERALHALSGPALLTPEQRSLRVYLESHVGDLRRSAVDAEVLLRHETDPSRVAQLKEVIGRATLVHGGSVERGLQLLTDVRDLAAAHLGPDAHARAACDLALASMQRRGEGLHRTALDEARVLVQHAGSRSLTVLPYLIDAEWQAVTGNLSDARASLEMVTLLLQQENNPLLDARWAIIASGVAVLDARYLDALAHAEYAIVRADVAGAVTVRVPALGMLAYARFITGDDPGCEQAIDQGLRLARSGSAGELALLDTRLQLLVDRGDAAQAAQLADRVSARLSDATAQHACQSRWFLLTRARWLLQRGDIDAADALISDADDRARRSGDRPLRLRLTLLRVELLLAAGQWADARALVDQLRQQLPVMPLGLFADVEYAAGLTDWHEPTTARLSLERAQRIYIATGQQRGSRRVDARLAALPPQPSSNDAPTHTRLLDRMAAVAVTVPHPLLCGLEVLHLVRDAGLGTDASLIARGDQGRERVVISHTFPGPVTPPVRTERTWTLELGLLGAERLELRVEPTPGAAARDALTSLSRLLQSLPGARLPGLRGRTTDDEPAPDHAFGIVARAPISRTMIDTVRRAAPTSVPILITGETGTGKELLARAVHLASPRARQVFIPFNCTTVPRDMIDAQLFGHRRGAFTGASEPMPGLLRAADGGTLLLDEIGDMPVELQPKLLRFLETGEVLPLGESRVIHVNVRIVASTNAYLEHLVQAGRFRADLLYRLNAVHISVPPLRERREDIPDLVHHLMARLSAEMQREAVSITPHALDWLMMQSWPGNVRQLANLLRRALVLGEPGEPIGVPHLVLQPPAAPPSAAPVARDEPLDEARIRLDQPLAHATDLVERLLIARALEKTGGNVERAAVLLGISRKGLFLKRQRYGLS
jgi:DNA-binding NtrC family response regulator